MSAGIIVVEVVIAGTWVNVTVLDRVFRNGPWSLRKRRPLRFRIQGFKGIRISVQTGNFLPHLLQLFQFFIQSRQIAQNVRQGSNNQLLRQRQLDGRGHHHDVDLGHGILEGRGGSEIRVDTERQGVGVVIGRVARKTGTVSRAGSWAVNPLPP